MKIRTMERLNVLLEVFSEIAIILGTIVLAINYLGEGISNILWVIISIIFIVIGILMRIKSREFESYVRGMRMIYPRHINPDF